MSNRVTLVSPTHASRIKYDIFNTQNSNDAILEQQQEMEASKEQQQQ